MNLHQPTSSRSLEFTRTTCPSTRGKGAAAAVFLPRRTHHIPDGAPREAPADVRSSPHTNQKRPPGGRNAFAGTSRTCGERGTSSSRVPLLFPPGETTSRGKCQPPSPQLKTNLGACFLVEPLLSAAHQKICNSAKHKQPTPHTPRRGKTATHTEPGARGFR